MHKNTAKNVFKNRYQLLQQKQENDLQIKIKQQKMTRR